MSIVAAIEAAGSSVELSRRLGVSQQRLTNWRRRGVPADAALAVAKAVDYQVTPHELRPDIYPNPTDGLPADAA